ncbi:PD40 domain-containing protein [Microvirga sp. BT350]|uniref:PD40 domain-containing protein n=2 Tax=Microvirga alba TaxID=2791025 RepID=A0A931BRX8_9HYPH|nr:PD40 domain-containing protein [Microvirga alba]
MILVSKAADGTHANGVSYGVNLSADGRYVLFRSEATNLVAGDTNDKTDLFRKDLETGAITRVSTAANGAQANADSGAWGDISADGRYVLFSSDADNLVAGDTNGKTDIFRKDLNTGEIIRVSTAVDGTQANGESVGISVSADGRYAVFESQATNLVAGGTNGKTHVFRKDLQTGEVTILSMSADGTQGSGNSFGAGISSDGRYVVISSNAGNLVSGDTNRDFDVFRVDTTLLPYGAAIAQGRFVEAKLGVGSASKVSVAWGDGTTDTMTPSSGSAAFSHTYATTGVKSASVTVVQGAQSWIVPYKIDLSSAQMTRNTLLADTLSGGTGKDTLKGDDYANILRGGLGNDTLTGGAGKDVFVFDTKPNKKANLDKITDFKVKDDSIWLDNAVFKKLGKGTEDKPGKLNKGFFTIGEAKDKNDYLVYNDKTGRLSYDADGNGAGKAVEIAILSKHLKLTAADFFVI